MQDRNLMHTARRTAWMLAAASTLTLCSCRATPWSSGPDQVAGGAPNSRFAGSSEWHKPATVPATASIADTQFLEPDPYANVPQPLPVPAGLSNNHQHLQAAYNAPALPKSAYHGVRYEVVPCGREECVGGCETCRGARGHHGAGGHHGGAPLPCPGGDPFSGIPDCTRMPDEYICDGGDREVNVSVLPDWTVRGLDTEDTIAHYDTLQGETVIEESNRVCIYAPRFAAVRSVKGLIGHQQMENPLAARDRLLPHQDDIDTIVTTSVQHQQPLGKFGLKPVTIYEQRDMGIPIEKTYIVSSVFDSYMPHEDFRLIKFGVYDSAEKARLANMVDNAIAWTHDAAVKVAIDDKLPVEASNNFAAEQLYVYDFGESRLRIVKTASKQNARPGEIVDFTLRFDNIGDQTIGNVTVIDSLTTRLEYVEGSVQSSVAADFYTQENEGESLVLRFEVANPVKVGEGGVIRFQARVR